MDANSMTSLNHIRDELRSLYTSLVNQPDSMSLKLVKAIKEKFIELNHALTLPPGIDTLKKNDIEKLNEICSKLKKKALKTENIFRRHINNGIVTEQDLEPIVKASEILKNLARTLKMHGLTPGSVSFESKSIQTLKSEDRLPNQNYEQALKEFKNHINDLANPLLVKDILQTIKDIEVIDPNEGIADNFSKLNLPKETDSYLKELNAQMVTRVFRDPDQINKIIEAIKKDLEEFAQEMTQQETPALWDLLEIFYRLPAIRKLKNEDVKKIVQGINRGNIAQARTSLHRILKDNRIEESEINKQITDCKSKIPYTNISTLIAQVIKQKPKKQEGIISYWNNDPTFFMNKTLFLKDPNSHESYSGDIVNCYRDEHHTLVLILPQSTEVRISHKKEIMEINQGNEEMDENKMRLLHAGQIEKNIDKLCKTLLKPENTEFLDQLIDNLVKNQLKSVDISMVAYGRRDRFLERLEDISNDYETKLNNIYQPADILKEIVEQAYCVRLIKKRQREEEEFPYFFLTVRIATRLLLVVHFISKIKGL